MDNKVIYNYEIAREYIKRNHFFPFLAALFTNRSFFKKFTQTGFTNIKEYVIRIYDIKENDHFGLYRTYIDNDIKVVLIDDIEGIYYCIKRTGLHPSRYSRNEIFYEELELNEYWKLWNLYQSIKKDLW